MRKVFLGAMVFASVMAFTSCNNEEIVVNGNGSEIVEDVLQAGEGVFELGVTNTGVDSRAGRPIGSSAAANLVNKVKLVVYKKAGKAWQVAEGVSIKNVDGETTGFDGLEFDWSAGPVGEGNSTDDRYGKMKVKLQGLEASTTYKIVAYGYTDSDVYGSTDANNDLVFETQNPVNGFDITEIFAGTTYEVETAGDDDPQYKPGNFTKYVSVIMERQVAGMLGYFENVPSRIAEKRVAKIEVVANKKMEKFRFPSDKDFNGIAPEEAAKDVLLTFDLSKIATNYKDAYNRWLPYTFTDLSTEGYKGEDETRKMPFAEGYKAPKGLKLKANSIFGGRFIMPYDKHYEEQTLVVNLLAEDGEVLKSFNVTTKQSGVDKNKYDIRRNNFYSVGKKLKSEEITDPTDPDKPIDLTSNTDVTVIINDAWEVLHDMDIED